MEGYKMKRCFICEEYIVKCKDVNKVENDNYADILRDSICDICVSKDHISPVDKLIVAILNVNK